MAKDVDKDLQNSLKLARKRPCNFAILAKGAQVLKLLVDKKPIKDGELQKAKKEYQANLIVKGVCVGGDGPEMVFQVLELPSLAEEKFKKFLADEAGLTLKPRFEVVAELAEISEDVVQEALPASASAPAPSAAAPSAAAPSAAAPSAAAPSAAAPSAAAPSAAAPSAPAPSAPAPSAPAPSAAAGTPPAAPPEAGDGASAAQLSAVLNKLAPAIKAAVTSHPDRKGEILTTVAAAKKQIDAGQFPEAKQSLQACAVLLRELQAGAPQPSSPAAGRLSLVKLGKARLEWLPIRDSAIQDVRRLSSAIAEEFRDDREQAQQLTAALKRLDGVIANLDNDLHSQLDAVLNADETGRPPLIDTVRQTIASFCKFVEADPVLAAIDDNEVLPGMSVKAPLVSKLGEISAALG